MESKMMPVHPGAVLREDILKHRKLSVERVAKELNVSQDQLSEVVNETAPMSAEMASILESAFGVSAEFWLDMQAHYDMWKARTRLELKRGSGKGVISRLPDNFTDELKDFSVLE